MASTSEQIREYILNNATVIKKDEVLQHVTQSVREILRTRDKTRTLYVNLPIDKIGSQQWIYLNINDYLPEHRIFINPSGEESGKAEKVETLDHTDIFFIEDWILSGSHMAGEFERILSEMPESVNVNYYIITYVMGSKGLNEIEMLKKFYPNVNFHVKYDVLIKPLDELGAFSKEDIDRFHEQIGHEEGSSFLIYSDYKVPNTFGSYPEVYSNVEIDRAFMANVEDEFKRTLAAV